MDTRRASAFEHCALASGLLKPDQLDEAWAALCPAEGPPAALDSLSDERLAEKVVQLGWLNRWQSKQLLEGRTKFNLGLYWMVDSIGRGGMGQVFKAQHEVLGRLVAVKVLPRSKSTPEAIANFMREIQHLAKLDHPNLVRALDAGEDGNVYYLVTELVPGNDLRKLVRRSGRLSMEAAAGILSQVAAGLQHAHEQGLIHRDVKPGNVLVTPEGHAKLSDLGLAGPVWGDAETDPRFGKIVGTADYLSPDHILAPWTPMPTWDIYSLGCTLYYAVTGKVPYPGGSTADKVRAHCELQPLDPRRLNPALSASFVELLADMMAKDPSRRIPTARTVISRLAPWTSTAAPVPLADDDSDSSAELFSATPIRISTGSADGAPGGPDSPQLKDTVGSLPEIPEGAPGQKDPSSESSEVTRPVASALQETWVAMERGGGRRARPLAIFHPLVVLVLFPSSLVGLVMLVWWLARLLI